jgi:hypothetical protein
VPVKKEAWDRPAVKGDIAGPVIKTSIAVDIIIAALEKLQRGEDISEQLTELRIKSADLDKMFDDLTGWEQG